MRFRKILVRALSLSAFVAGCFVAGFALFSAFAQQQGDAVSTAVQIACSNGGALLQYLGYAALAIIPATALTNIRALHGIPILGTVINLLAGNWRSWLRQAAAAAAKTSPVLLVLVTGPALLLAACTPQELQMVSATAQVSCAVVQADLANAMSQPGATDNATLVNVGAYVKGGCPIVNNAITVAENVAADPNGVEWLNGLDAAVKAAAQATTPAAPATAS